MSYNIKIDKTKCNLCGACIEICPMEVFVMSETKVSEDLEEPKKVSEKEIKIKEGKCIGCKACEMQCDKQAIKIDDG